MVKDIREKLIELARLQTTWTYSTLNEQLMLGLNFNNVYDRDLIGDWLGEISEHEYSKGRPLLSCLITHKNGMREQGDGFYKLCERLYGENWQKLKSDKKWEKGLIADCYEFWLDPIKYKKFKNDF
jgi:hypothetical protein